MTTSAGEQPTQVDWTVLELKSVPEIAYRAARRVASEYTGLANLDDERQEALILLACDPDRVREHVQADTLGQLHHWLWCRLVDKLRPIASRANRTISYERLTQETAV